MTEDVVRWLLAAYAQDWRWPRSIAADDAGGDDGDEERPPAALGAALHHVVSRLMQSAAALSATAAEAKSAAVPHAALKRPGISKVAMVSPIARRQRVVRIAALICRAADDASSLLQLEIMRSVGRQRHARTHRERVGGRGERGRATFSWSSRRPLIDLASAGEPGTDIRRIARLRDRSGCAAVHAELVELAAGDRSSPTAFVTRDTLTILARAPKEMPGLLPPFFQTFASTALDQPDILRAALSLLDFEQVRTRSGQGYERARQAKPKIGRFVCVSVCVCLGAAARLVQPSDGRPAAPLFWQRRASPRRTYGPFRPLRPRSFPAVTLMT